MAQAEDANETQLSNVDAGENVLERKRVAVSFGVDFWLRSIEQLVSIAPVENDEANGSEAKNKRCNAGISNRWDESVKYSATESSEHTNNHKVDILWKQLAPSHASHGSMSVVFLARSLVKEAVVQNKEQNISVVQDVAWGICQGLDNKVGKVRVGCPRKTLCKKLGYRAWICCNLRRYRSSSRREGSDEEDLKDLKNVVPFQYLQFNHRLRRVPECCEDVYNCKLC